MALEDELNGHNDIAHFLEKFKEPAPAQPQEADLFTPPSNTPVRPAQYARSFEKLEQKIHELEEKFEASTTQNQLILNELARTREVMERQKDKDAFMEHLSRTIATLRTSVENLSRAQQTQSFSLRENPVQRSFDPLPTVFAPTHTDVTPAYLAAEQTDRLRREREEQDRLYNSLRQKASQLKAVNSALDREIKKAQQEKMDALKKSADQAKEILSLRDQLSAAEERFKSFDFEGRIISIKQEYQQKVTSLETQLKAMSDKCIEQVEQIESLKVQNTKLQTAAAEKEALKVQLEGKEQELNALKQTIASLQQQQSDQHSKQLSTFTAQLRELEEQRDRLAVELEQSQISLETIRREKDVLENNFKELVEKINSNDTIIGQLKEKIEVLGRQNEQLTQSNAVLVQDNEALSKNNVELTHRNASLTQHNATLSRHAEMLEEEKKSLSAQVENLGKQAHELGEQKNALNSQKQTLTQQVEQLSREKQTLEQDRQTLSDQHNDLQQRTQALENQKRTLTEENQQLRNQSAALLAARVVQQHAQKEREKASAQQTDAFATQATGEALRRPQSPVLHSLGRVLPTASAEEEWEVVSVKAPVPAQIKSTDDLPEIKVAEPTPQYELFDGEDFLEKTDSFIGRMKWSIFRENR